MFRKYCTYIVRQLSRSTKNIYEYDLQAWVKYIYVILNDLEWRVLLRAVLQGSVERFFLKAARGE